MHRLAILVLLSLPMAANAVPIVSGSTYDVALLEGGFGLLTTGGRTLTFDGVGETFALDRSSNAALVTVNESQTSLGGNDYLVSILFNATDDIYPGNPGSNGAILAGIGAFGNALDFVFDVKITSAIFSVFNSSGALLANSDFINSIGNPDPWDGIFPRVGAVSGYTPATGLDITRMQLDFYVTRVPEPSTLVLLGIGLAGIGFASRRRMLTQLS